MRNKNKGKRPSSKLEPKGEILVLTQKFYSIPLKIYRKPFAGTYKDIKTPPTFLSLLPKQNLSNKISKREGLTFC